MTTGNERGRRPMGSAPLAVDTGTKQDESIFYIGLGDRFDGDKVKAYPPGSVIVLPGNTSHFHWAKAGEYVTQVTAIGRLGLEYLDSDDDPREQIARSHQQGAPSFTA